MRRPRPIARSNPRTTRSCNPRAARARPRAPWAGSGCRLLSAAAALAVDSGAAAQAQQASAMAQAAEEAARAPAKKKATERQVTADPATGEIRAGPWPPGQMKTCPTHSALPRPRTRLQLARELSRRRAERDQQTRPLRRPHRANPSTQQGSIDGTQADQAQPPRAESSQAAGAQGAPVAGPGPAQELTNGTTSSPARWRASRCSARPAGSSASPNSSPAHRCRPRGLGQHAHRRAQGPGQAWAV
jgi:type IV secretory pathway VirB10-like protein